LLYIFLTLSLPLPEFVIYHCWYFDVLLSLPLLVFLIYHCWYFFPFVFTFAGMWDYHCWYNYLCIYFFFFLHICKYSKL